MMTGIIKYVLHSASCKGLDEIRFKEKKRRGPSLNVKPDSHLNTVRTYICAPQPEGRAGASRRALRGLWDGGVGQHVQNCTRSGARMGAAPW